MRFDCWRYRVAMAISTTLFATLAHGSVFLVTNSNTGNVSQVSATGVVSPFGSTGSFTAPLGIAVDTTGTSYIAMGDNSLARLSANGSVLTKPFNTSAISTPVPVAFHNGSLYVGVSGGIQKVDLSGNVSSFFTLANKSFWGLAFDSGGNLYGADVNDGTVLKIAANGLSSTPFASGFSTPEGLTFDSAGNLYVANRGNNTISKVNSSGTLVSTFTLPALNGISTPLGLLTDSSGTMYVVLSQSSAGGEIDKFSATGTFTPFVTSGLSGPVFMTELPEPSALAIVGCGSLLLLARRRRHVILYPLSPAV